MLDMDAQLSTMSIEDQRSVVEPMEKLEEVTLDYNHPKRVIHVGTYAVDTTQQELVIFLTSNIDMFAWSHEEMPGIDPRIMVHRLNMSPSFSTVHQKRRVFALERNEAIAEEVQKLLAAGFIKEAYYPNWLSNVVIVKKANGKWRMCIDFTDLNKACPKDNKWRIDAFSRYNQIKRRRPLSPVKDCSITKSCLSTQRILGLPSNDW